MKKFALILFILISQNGFSQFKVEKTNPEINETLTAQSFSATGARKKPALAILYSALIPGMGEWYAEDFSSGYYFTAAEAALWSVYLGMSSYASWQKNNYTSFAAVEGSVNTENKSGEFFADIGNYTSIEQFNDEKAFYRQFDNMYDPKTHFWKWENETERKAYRTMWLASQRSNNNLRFVVGGMLLNRLISIINAVRLTSRYNKSLNEETTWNISITSGFAAQPMNEIQINFLKAF